MAHIIFYEKPGCQTNARQRALLAQAGHALEVRNLLTERWTGERLRAFFGDKPASQWFNRAAPRVKSGEINPVSTGDEAALALMLADPLLIRRPLMECGQWRCAGFDAIAIDDAVGLRLDRTAEEAGPLEGCAHDHGSGGDTGRSCPAPTT